MGSYSEPALPWDVFVWGSTTKMFTAASILQLVERGLVGLEDPIFEHVDAMLPGDATLTTAVVTADARVADVTVRMCLHMTSGLGDYDGEAYGAAQFAQRGRDFSPIDILLGGFVPTALSFAPGARQQYCSTNYVLLGLVAARYDGANATAQGAWRGFDQLSVARSTRAQLNTSKFVDAGESPHTLPPYPVSSLECV